MYLAGGGEGALSVAGASIRAGPSEALTVAPTVACCLPALTSRACHLSQQSVSQHENECQELSAVHEDVEFRSDIRAPWLTAIGVLLYLSEM